MPKQLISEDPETANTMSSDSDYEDEEKGHGGMVGLTSANSEVEMVTLKGGPPGRSNTDTVYPILKRASRSFGKKIRPRSMSGDVYVDDEEDDNYDSETHALQPKKTVRMSGRDEEITSKPTHGPSRIQQGLLRIFRRHKKEEAQTGPHRTRKRKKNDDFVVVQDHDTNERITYLRSDSPDAASRVSLREAFEESRKDITTNKMFWIDFQNPQDLDAIVKGVSLICGNLQETKVKTVPKYVQTK